MSIDIHVPTLGESVSDATIARWIKKAFFIQRAIVASLTDSPSVGT